MQGIKELLGIDGKSLLALEVEPPKFIVSRFLPIGLHILSGSAKIGKSWLSLWLCQQISHGEKVCLMPKSLHEVKQNKKRLMDRWITSKQMAQVL